MRQMSYLLFSLGFLCAGASSAWAQATTAAGTLQGTVTDPTAAVIPGANVTISNKSTGLQRTETTNNTGSYVFNLLPAGIYEVRVTAKGFASGLYENVELFVGRTTTIDARLSPSQQTETVTVEAGGAALVDLQKTDVSQPISPAEVENMPLNSRDFVSLAILAPGARPVTSYDPTKARYGVFSVDGSSGRNVNMTVNGVDNKDNSVGGPVMQLPLEAIEEFNISTQRFSAANGRSEGAAVNVVTKSGTNQFHGSLFFQDQNQVFDALDYFQEAAHGGNGQKAPFSRQEFGGSIGGPVKKDKTFLFFAIERERQTTSINTTSTSYLNDQALASVPNLPLKLDPTQVIPIPYYDWRYNGRVDHRINDKNTFSASYTNQNNRGLNDQDTTTADLSQNNFTTNQLIIANATLNSVISPTIVNSATVGYQYWNNLIATTDYETNLTFPDLTVGTNANVPQNTFQKKWQFKDDYAFIHGSHSFKVGVDFVYEPVLGGFFLTDPTPVISFFADPLTMLTTPSQYPEGLSTPGAVQSITQATTGNSYYSEDNKMFGLYFQDDWKVNRRLSLNLGVRWDKDMGLNGGSVQAQSRAYLELKAIGSPYAGIPHDENKDFSPRFGLAYGLTNSGKHVIRLGYGLYFGQIFQNIPLFMEQQANASLFTTVAYTSSGPGSPTASVLPSGELLSAWRFGVDPIPPQAPGAANLPTGATGQMMDPHYRNPYSEQWNGGYSWQVTQNSVIEVEYVHELGLHESKTIVINPTINGVRDTTAEFQALGLPVLGGIRDYMSIGRSRYDAMNLSYKRRLSRRFSINSSYVLSKAMAFNGNSAAFGNGPTDELNWFAAHDWGPTPADERNRITISGIVNLPWGVTFTPIMQWATGRPYNLTEGITDVYGYGSGVGTTHDIVLASAPQNLTATAGYTDAQLLSCLAANTCYQLPYNYARGEDLFQLDARFGKIFTFKERIKLEVFFQAFDLTNRANFGTSYGGNIRTSTFMQPTGFITASNAVVPFSFTGEFGARFSF
jgi:Carboxypeptidase regulatory-like domain/TonB dependent receptor